MINTCDDIDASKLGFQRITTNFSRQARFASLRNRNITTSHERGGLPRTFICGTFPKMDGFTILSQTNFRAVFVSSNLLGCYLTNFNLQFTRYFSINLATNC